MRVGVLTGSDAELASQRGGGSCSGCLPTGEEAAPLDFLSNYLQVAPVHFPGFVVPHLADEASQLTTGLLELLRDTAALLKDPGRLLYALQLSRRFEDSALHESVALSVLLRIAEGWLDVLEAAFSFPRDREDAARASLWFGEDADSDEEDASGVALCSRGRRPSLSHRGLSLSSTIRVCDALSATLSIVASLFVAPAYLSPSSKTHYQTLHALLRGAEKGSRDDGAVSAETLRSLRRLCLSWRLLLPQLIRRADRPLRTDLRCAEGRRRLLTNALVRLSVNSRFLWCERLAGLLCEAGTREQPCLRGVEGGEDAAASPKSCLCFCSLKCALRGLMDGADARSSDVSIRARLLLLFAPPSLCLRFVDEKALFRWWGLCEGSALVGFDFVFVSLLRRAAKEAWATGRPLCCRLGPFLPFLLQIALRLFAVVGRKTPAAQRLRSCAESAPSEYSAFLPKGVNTVGQLAKLLALLLEPIAEEETAAERRQREALKKADARKLAAAAIAASSCANGEKVFPGEVLGGRLQETAFFSGSLPTKAADSSAASRAPSSAFALVEALLKSVSIWLHPQAEGPRALGALSEFVNGLSSAYLRRVQRERLPDGVRSEGCGSHLRGQCQKGSCCLKAESSSASSPGSRCCRGKQLGPREDRRIVELLLPVVLQGLFLKQGYIAADFERGLQDLVALVPEVALDAILNRATEALESVTDANQAQLLHIMARLANPIMKFSPTSLGLLLRLSLDGIEPADPLKTFVTLGFHCVVFWRLPPIACPDVATLTPSQMLEFNQNPNAANLPPPFAAACPPTASTLQKESVLAIPSSANALAARHFFHPQLYSLRDGDVPLDRPADAEKTPSSWNAKVAKDAEFFAKLVAERAAVAATFPDWALEWLTRILRFVELASKPEANGTNFIARVERGTEVTLSSAANAILGQLDAETTSAATASFLRWSENPYLEGARLAQGIVAAFVGASPESAFLEELLRRAESRLLQSGGCVSASSTKTGAASNKAFRWNASVSTDNACWQLLLLAGAVRWAGAALVPLEFRLTRLICLAFRQSDLKVGKAAAKLLRRCVEALTGVYPLALSNCRSMSYDQWKDSRRRQLSLLLWGEPFWKAAGGESLSWHEPSFKEEEAALRLSLAGMREAFLLAQPFLKSSSGCLSSSSKADSGQKPPSPPFTLREAVSGWGEEALRRDFLLDDSSRVLAEAEGSPSEEWLRRADAGEFEDFASGFSSATCVEEEERLSIEKEDTEGCSASPPSVGQRASLSLRIASALVKAASLRQPDERPRQTPLFPVVLPLGSEEVRASQQTACKQTQEGTPASPPPLFFDGVLSGAATLTLRLAARVLKGQEASGPNASPSAAVTAAEAGGEEARVLEAVLKSCKSLLLRSAASLVPTSEPAEDSPHSCRDSRGAAHQMELLSVWEGAFDGGFLLDSPRVLWAEIVLQDWKLRTETRRFMKSLRSWRAAVLSLVVKLSVHEYPQTRLLAAKLLLRSLSLFGGSTSSVVDILQRQVETALREEEGTALEAAAERTGEAQEGRDSLGDAATLSLAKSSAESLEARRRGVLRGGACVLGSVTIMRRFWRDPKRLARFVQLTLSALRVVKDQPTAKNWAAAACALVTNREQAALANDWSRAEIEHTIIQPLLSSLLNEQPQTAAASSSSPPTPPSAPHWLVVLTATGICVCLCDASPSSLSPSVREAYFRWLLRAADRVVHPPLINALALLGIMRVLRRSRKLPANELQYLQALLREPATLATLFSALESTNRGGCASQERSEAEGGCQGPSSSSSPGVSFVAAISGLEKRPPWLRGGRVSAAFSVSNASFVQTLFEFLLESSDSLEEGDPTPRLSADFATLLKEGLAPCLSRFLNCPPSELEGQTAASELVAGVAAAVARSASVPAREAVFAILCPLVAAALPRLEEKTLDCWSDALRFALAPPRISLRLEDDGLQRAELGERRRRLVPLLNLFVDYGAAAASEKKAFSRLREFGDTRCLGSNEIVRQLRLFSTLVSVAAYSAEAHCDASAIAEGEEGSPGSSSSSAESGCVCCCGCCFAHKVATIVETVAEKFFAFPHKQIREKVASLLAVVMEASSRDVLSNAQTKPCPKKTKSCACSPVPVSERLWMFLIQQAAKALPQIATKVSGAADRRVGEGREAEVHSAFTAAATVLNLLTKRSGALFSSLAADGEALLSLLVAMAVHPEVDLSALGNYCLQLLCLTQVQRPLLRDAVAAAFGGEERNEDRAVETQRAEKHSLVLAIASFGSQPSWKVRALVPSLLELMVCQHRVLLWSPLWQQDAGASAFAVFGFAALKALASAEAANLSKQAQLLRGHLAKAKEGARSARRCCYIEALLHLAFSFYRRVLAAMAGKVGTPLTSPSARPLGGVCGLSALLEVAPFDIPEWLPPVIETIAVYAAPSAPDALRVSARPLKSLSAKKGFLKHSADGEAECLQREVERALQLLLKTHQDQWATVHAPKLSAEQLEALDLCKGRPSYFA